MTTDTPARTVKRPNHSSVGDRVICNGYPGTVIRTEDSAGSAWLGGMVEVRLERGTVCVSDSAPDVVLAAIEKAAG